MNATLRFYFGNNNIPISDHANHLGIIQSSNRKNTKSVEQSCERGRNAFFAINGIGARKRGLNPVTGTDLYRKIVLPSALYGSELWNNLDNKNIREINKFQHMVCRSIQGFPALTRSDMSESLLGLTTLSIEVDIRKLTFLEKLISLSNDSQAKLVFISRLFQNLHSNQSDGFVYDVRKLLAKYVLSDYLLNYAKFVVFPSKYTWKRTVNAAVRNSAVTERNQRMLVDEQFSRFRQIHMENNPAFPYSISSSTTDILMAEHYIKLWIRIPYNDSFLCTYCNIVTNDTPVHIVAICQRFEFVRNSFLNIVRERHGTELYEELSQTSPELLFLKIIGAPTTTIITEMTAFRKLCMEYIYKCIHVL